MIFLKFDSVAAPVPEPWNSTSGTPAPPSYRWIVVSSKGTSLSRKAFMGSGRRGGAFVAGARACGHDLQDLAAVFLDLREAGQLLERLGVHEQLLVDLDHHA